MTNEKHIHRKRGARVRLLTNGATWHIIMLHPRVVASANPVRSRRRAASMFSSMKAIVYDDGFSLYYGAVKGTSFR